MGRFRLICLLLALSVIGLPQASRSFAASVSTERQVYRYGETVEIQYDTTGLRSADLELNYTRETMANVEIGTTLGRWWQLRGGESGLVRADTTKILHRLTARRADLDSYREFIRITLSGSPENAPATRISKSSWILIVNEVAPRPGAIDIAARDRIVYGERLNPVIQDLDDLIAASGNPHSPGLSLDLVQLGRVVQGGAVIPDRRFRSIDLGNRPAGIAVVSSLEAIAMDNAGKPLSPDSTLIYPAVGHYELQLVGFGRSILDRVSFTVAAPERVGTLRLEPQGAGTYDYNAAPSVFFDVDPGWSAIGWAGWMEWLAVRLGRIEPGDRVERNATSGGYLSDDILAGRPALDARFTSGGLRPASYGVALEGLVMSPDRARVMWWDEVLFNIGGDYPQHWLPTRPTPALDYDKVGMTLSRTGDIEVGTPLEVTLSPPEGIDLAQRGAWVEVRYAEKVCGFGSRLFVAAQKDDLFQIGKLPVVNNGVRFTAPAVPDIFEVRLVEKDSDGESVLLAKREFSTVLSERPGAISLGSVALGEPIVAAVTAPAGHVIGKTVIELYRSPEIAPGGVPTHLDWIAKVAVDPASGEARLGPIYSPGRYELRLKIGSGNNLNSYWAGDWGFDRVFFSVEPTADMPKVPDFARYRNAEDHDEWPSPDDVLRKSSLWLAPAGDCAAPEVPPDAEISLVEWRANVPDDPADDTYPKVMHAFPGHPYHVEARFSQAPSTGIFSVSTQDGTRIEVKRTSDPVVYRSEAVTFIGGGAAP